MLNKTDLKIFAGSLMLVALLATTYVAIDGGFDKGHEFINLKKFETEFPVGSNYNLLEEKVLSLGYAKYPCKDSPSVNKEVQLTCFIKRRCYEPSGWDGHAFKVSHGSDGKTRTIEVLGMTMTMGQTCAEADRFQNQQR